MTWFMIYDRLHDFIHMYIYKNIQKVEQQPLLKWDIDNYLSQNNRNIYFYYF
jgi:hypothetical protein